MCTEIIELVARAVSFHLSADTSYVGKWVNIWLKRGLKRCKGRCSKKILVSLLQYENIAFLLQATRFSTAPVCEALLQLQQLQLLGIHYKMEFLPPLLPLSHVAGMWSAIIRQVISM